MNADSQLNQQDGPLGFNMFAYCCNNPINCADPTGRGLISLLLLGGMVAGLLLLSGCSSTVNKGASNPTTTQSQKTDPTPKVPSRSEKMYAATVYAEAGGQNQTSKRAVAHVMNNRIGTTSSRKTIDDVISESQQFDGYGSAMYNAAIKYYNTGICDNDLDRKAMDESMSVVISIYSGEDVDITGGALYFHSFTNPSDWTYHDDYTLIDVPGTENFWFYK